MADHSKPLVTSTYANFVTELDNRFDDLTLGLDPATTTPTNLPVGAIRWNSSSAKWEKWSGTIWADLATAYAINLAGPITLEANSTSDALRITQIGSGNALVVEDSANPDSTPFVIDASGRVCIGATSTAYSIEAVGYSGAPTWASTTHVNNQNGSYFRFGKARGGTATPSIVQDGDNLGNIRFYGYDSVDFILAARIDAAVDGTPGTNDMPGRLVFSTTADGASSPTERMRIDSAGCVGIGSGTANGINLQINKNITGATNATSIRVNGAIQLDATNIPRCFDTQPSTVANATVASLYHFSATQGTFGTGSAVTNQMGFAAGNTLSGATNNYGFYSSITSGTGRYNFYAAGTADNYFAGRVGIGLVPGHAKLTITGGSSLPSPTTDATGDAYGTLTLGNTDGTPANGAFSSAIAFTGISSSRRRAFIGAIQDTADGDQFGLQFFTRNAVVSSNSALNTNYALYLSNDNQLYVAPDGGLNISKTAVTAPAATDGNVFSGTYTPTITNGTNVSASTAQVNRYTRVGNQVTIHGSITLTFTAANTNSAVRMNFPIASGITATTQGRLTGTSYTLSNRDIISGQANITNDDFDIRCYPSATGAISFQYIAMYEVA